MKQGTAIRDIRKYVDVTEIDLIDGQTIVLDRNDVEVLEENFGDEYECRDCGTSESLVLVQPGLR